MNEHLVNALREHDQGLAELPLTLGSDMRIRRRLARENPRRAGYLPWVLMATAAALCSLFVLWSARWDTADDVSAAPAGLEPATQAACAWKAGGASTELEQGCTLQLGPLRLTTRETTRLRRSHGQLELVQGRAGFDVTPVPPGEPPIQVHVPGGIIEVVGTRFGVSVRGEQGLLVVEEGRVRFLSHGQPARELGPGGRHRWWLTEPAPAASSHETEPAPRRQIDRGEPPTPRLPRPDRSPPRTSSTTVDDSVERALELRASGRYDEALSELDGLQRRFVDPRTSEVLDYERSTLLLRAGKRERACAELLRYLRVHPRGHRRAAVEQLLGEKCAPVGGN